MTLPARRSTVALSALLALLSGATAARAAEALIDPTRPSTLVAAHADGGIRVQAIISRGTERVAIVDGHLVRAGDRIADALIEAVTPEGVRYSQNGHRAFARLAVLTLAVRRPPTHRNQVP